MSGNREVIEIDSDGDEPSSKKPRNSGGDLCSYALKGVEREDGEVSEEEDHVVPSNDVHSNANGEQEMAGPSEVPPAGAQGGGAAPAAVQQQVGQACRWWSFIMLSSQQAAPNDAAITLYGIPALAVKLQPGPTLFDRSKLEDLRRLTNPNLALSESEEGEVEEQQEEEEGVVRHAYADVSGGRRVRGAQGLCEN